MATTLDTLKRNDLVAAACEAMPGYAGSAWLKCTNDELRAAIEYRVVPDKVADTAHTLPAKPAPKPVSPKPEPPKPAAGLTVSDVRAIVAELLEGKPATKPVADTDEHEHELLPAILRFMDLFPKHGKHAYLVGPAGTGKSYIARQLARKRGVPFGAISLRPTPVSHEIFGYMSATGQYVRTLFRECYEHGGVYLFDEMDKAHPGDLASVNDALAGNGGAAFPDGMVKRHKDFRAVAAANTFGLGADRQYVGSQQIDAATRNRFGMFQMQIDEKLEANLAYDAGKSKSLTDKWLKRVRHYRAKAGSDAVVSPRDSIAGACLVADDMFTVGQVENMLIFDGLPASVVSRMKAGVPAW